jgi:hypothetical protein
MSFKHLVKCDKCAAETREDEYGSIPGWVQLVDAGTQGIRHSCPDCAATELDVFVVT